MMPDLIDRAFMERFAPAAAHVVDVPCAAAAAPGARDPDSATPQVVDSVVVDPVVATLLESHPDQWRRLADRVEDAMATGDIVIAVVGRERAEGRSTVVAGLGHVLRRRGHSIDCRHHPSDREPCAESHALVRPVIVDAGVWFPKGPVHRGRVARAAIGCHAVVLVRRATRAPCPIHGAVLAGLGVHVLGEVVTFAEAAHPLEEQRS